MRPLRICFLWHQHQPDYRTKEGFFLPWVRMHATKDYLDLPLIMQDYPLRHTINLVPSMLVQVEEYLQGRQDPVQKLCGTPPESLSPGHRDELLSWARTVQLETMTDRLPRLRELVETADSASLSDQDILDLQVLLHLAWTGPVSRRNSSEVQELMERGRGYTTADRAMLFSYHEECMRSLVSTLTEMEKKGKIEISVTPYHHPILPLLCDTNAALESRPDVPLPDPPFSSIQDAHWHVSEAIEYWKDVSGNGPQGMWPAEGSVSTPALSIMAQNGIRWAATDEDVLKNSLGVQYRDSSPFHPYTVETEGGDIALLFRDHGLSDAIGFEYSRWDPVDAANDFVSRLLNKRELIVDQEGEDALEHAVVPVILDGENCWEFYRDNGEPFLRALFERLSNTDLFESVTCSSAIDIPARPILSDLVAGSWINGNFDIWIGDSTKNLAWSLLRDVREQIRRLGDPDRLMEVIYKLEASDWFWWYEERHQAPHKDHFDSTFRDHLLDIFRQLKAEPPVDLQKPLKEIAMSEQTTTKSYPIVFGSSAMHDADAITDKIDIDTSGNWQKFDVHFRRVVGDDEEVFVTITDRHGASRRCGVVNTQVLFNSDRHDEGFDRMHDRVVSVYLHAATEWTIAIEEQRSSGGIFTSEIEVHLKPDAVG